MQRQHRPRHGSLYGYSSDRVTSQGSGKMNEDSMVWAPDRGLFAVFDGATSLNPFTSREGKSGAYLASHIASEVFSSQKGRLTGLVRKANGEIRARMLEEGVDVSNKLSQWMTSVAAIRLNRDSFDWVQVSDTNILVLYRDSSYRLLVENYDHDRETNMMLKGMVESGVKDLWAGISDQLKRNRLNSNVTYGFIAGEKTVKFVHSGRVSLGGVSDVLIFSDGMLFPKEDPTAPDDMDAIVREYRKGGVEGWLSAVRKMEDSDPGTRRYIRFKPHDDATAIAVRILAR